MTSMTQPSFDAVRPQTHQGIHSSPAGSPRIQRPASQTSLHIAPASYSPHVVHEQSPHPMSAYPAQTYRPYTPASMALHGPPSFISSSYPSTAPPLSFYPGAGPAPVYDSRGSQPMIRTISHAHPMASATDQTVSSRYSSSPHSASGPLMDGPPTASGQQPNTFSGMGIHTPSFNIQNADGEARSINPSLFNPGGGYSMSRSTSGASDIGPETTRLLTPAFEYRQDRLSPAEQELRKVSDSLGDPGRRSYSSTYTPSFDLPHTVNLGPHPQPDGVFFGGRGYGNDHFTLSAERGDFKPDLGFADTEYERERQARIMSNQKLMDDMGFNEATSAFRAGRSNSGSGGARPRKPSTPSKQRLRLDGPVRASPRLREMSRTVSYADLDDGAPNPGSDEDEYGSDAEQDEEDDFRPSKRSKGAEQVYRSKSGAYSAPKMMAKPQLSLWSLLNTYSQIPHLFPLFYYTLNNDLTINSDSVPLIGSIPSTCTPLEKAETLQGYFHRGRRVLAQLDAFSSRCDRKYEGPEQRWPELDYHTRIAIRDVRRKVVERCENYKYTRRDILDKVLGKNKWQPIDSGMIEWRIGMAENDPAGDLANVTLTLPTPPPDVYQNQMRYQGVYDNTRSIRPFPRSRIASAAPRSVSIAMGEPDDYAHPHTAVTYPPTSSVPMYAYSAQGPPPPQYGEDEVPMTVQMPTSSAGAAGPSTATSFGPTTAAPNSAWGDLSIQRGMKRSRSDEDDAESPEGEEATGYEHSYSLA
ncbi:hypothetical protein IAT40_002766 [Kwoniella sp. CBS 6097]